jgi:hypothetical protein
VQSIISASNARKIELERAEERRVQKERELEGEMFGDKEAFVTEAFKQKKLELERLEEEERRKEGTFVTFRPDTFGANSFISSPTAR